MTDTYTAGTAPGALPLLGHTIRLLGGLLRFLDSLPAYGDLVQVRVGSMRALVVCHPELYRQVLVDDRTFDKGGPFYDAARDVIGDGLATCPHSTHRRHRRLTQPAFHHTRIPGYAAVMTEEITRLVGSWRDGRRVDVFAEMAELTGRVASGTLFAAKQGHDRADDTRHDLATLSQGIMWRTVLPRAVMALPTPGNLRHDKAKARLRATIEGFIADYRRDGVDHGDLLSMLLSARDDEGGGLSDTEVHDHVLVFFLAGFDTTAATLSWVFHLLGRHPDIEERLLAEADQVLDGRVATWEDVPKLKLTSRIITETLRLYPPGWLFTRAVTTDTELGGHPLKAGTTVIVSPRLLHHRENLYDNPHHFDPDRWLDHPGGNQPHTGYAPFGGGARKCIGDTFGLTEATLALASIATRWQLRPVPGSHVRPRLRSTLVPRSLVMETTTRERATSARTTSTS